MTAWLLAQIAPYLAAAGAIIGALFWARRSGKRDAKRETALEAAERAAKLERERGKLDDEIQQDTDLVARAMRAGVVRDAKGGTE